MAKLDEYRNKRQDSHTPEPFGQTSSASAPTTVGQYVVHLHDARRRHYDVRLEVSGALESFAVPRGPSFDPNERRLAVRTEPHPLEYLDFEDVIPEGSYGAGPMIAWDRGQVRYVGAPAEEQLEKGRLEFDLFGHKLRGRFLLVRTKDDEKNWLLFKKHDAFAQSSSDVLEDKPGSIFSGLRIEELERAAEIAAEVETEAAKLGASVGSIEMDMVPMRAMNNPNGASGEGFSYELKLDGVRCIARKNGPDVLLQSRRIRDVTRVYPDVARAMSKLFPPRLVVDGEIVALDQSGHPSFERLAQRIHLFRQGDIRRASLRIPVLFIVFDLLAIGDYDLRSLPLSVRRQLLRKVVPATGDIRVIDVLEGDPGPLLVFCRDRKLEGLMAKRTDSIYRPGCARSDEWVKLKCEREEDFIVVGYTVGEGTRSRMGAIDVGSYEDGKLVYRAKVGSGLDDTAVETLLERLEPLRTNAATARGEYNPAPRGRVHVKPEVVVSVRFGGFSDGGSLRFPVFRGIRDDVAPEECTAAPHSDRAEAEVERLVSDAVATIGTTPGNGRTSLQNPDKVFFPDIGGTKRDLAEYYAAVAPVLLPHLADRPVMLVRYPDGIAGKFFYQWNVPEGAPSWVPTMRVNLHGRDDIIEVFHVRDIDTLLYIVNLATIPIHILASRKSTLDECDFLTIDLDISGGTFADVIVIAKSLRRLLDAIGLVGFPKTSGQSGLHVFVPLGPGISYDTARVFADLLGHALVRQHPDIATMERFKERRGPRVLVDTGQTGASRTIVAPYSVRAAALATVSTPLSWNEVDEQLDPRAFDLRTVPRRIALRDDPMAKLLEQTPNVAESAEILEKIVRGADTRVVSWR